MSENIPSRSPKQPGIRVLLAPDRMAAGLEVKAEGSRTYPDRETLLRAVAAAGVREGIKRETVEAMIRGRVRNKALIVAEGKRPVNGRDGYVQYLFENLPAVVVRPGLRSPAGRGSGETLRGVTAGTRIAVLVPPEEGRPGTDVCGEPVPAAAGKPAKMPAGPNTTVDPESPDVLLAACDGHVFLKGSVVQVDSAYTVAGDLNLLTGDVSFPGSLVVQGDVKSGCALRVGKNVEIRGTLEDAVVKAGGDVRVKGGFLGRGAGSIEAGGAVSVNFCEHQSIAATGDVVCSGGLLGAHVETAGTVRVVGKSGAIVGGEIVAQKGVLAARVGNEAFPKTVLIAGLDPTRRRRLAEVRLSLEKNGQNRENTGKAILTIGRMQLLKVAVPEEKLALLEKLKALQARLVEEEQDLKGEEARLSRVSPAAAKAEIRVAECVYPGVRIEILGESVTVNKRFPPCVFRLDSQGRLASFPGGGVPLPGSRGKGK